MKLSKNHWNAEKRSYERTFVGLVGRTCRVMDIERGQEDQIGYTSSNNQIHLAYDHPIMKDLNDVERVSFRKGVFAHESLHQIFTDFGAYERMLARYPVFERPIFSVFCNVPEDTAIEGFAPQVMGGTLLESLRFSIAYIYKQSPNLEESKSPFSQLINAMIQFGDMGLLKGNFTFPEARKIFVKIAPIFATCVEEPNCKKRLEYSREMMEIARPLWEEDVKNNEKMAEMMEELAKNCKSAMKGKGKGRDADEVEEGEESKASKRRKITIKKVSKEELEEMKKNGEITEADGGSGELPDGDITVVMCDEDESESKSGNGGMSIPGGESSDEGESSGSGNGTDDSEVVVEESEEYKKNKGKKGKKGEKSEEESEEESDEDSESKKSKGGKSSKSKKNSKDGDSKEGDSKDSDNSNGFKESDGKSEQKSKPQNSDDKNNPFVAPKTKEAKKVENQPTPEGFEESDEANKIGEISNEEYSLSESDVERIVEEIERAVEEYEKEQKAEESTTPIDNFPITSPKLGRKSCLNYRVSYSERDKEYLEETYSKVLAQLNPGIKSLTTQLRRIFENDYEEKEYRNSGKINLKRVHSGRVTARVFDKRVSPTGKSNFSVEILVDESGSMSGRNKDLAARYCCIALSEVFANLNIPVYIIGFTADTQGHDIVHNHYITWKNTHNERLKLLNITARANNCDGYSIRYATEVLKKNKAENKLLIVLSDGQPAAHGYYDGVHDTKQAIRDAKKQSSVLGVAIGTSDTETIHYMYEKDFLNIAKVDDLFAGLSRQLQKLMKSWGE